MFTNALISVSDKTGLVEFLLPLYAQGLRLVSTGGTAKHLRAAGMQVIDVAEQTGFPEVMDGRVKTLHPRIHMALLARVGHAEDESLLVEQDLAPFDLLIVNLYPFEKALREEASEKNLIENIDIGGPSLLRAGAKNFERVTVLVDPADYARVAQMALATGEDASGGENFRTGSESNLSDHAYRRALAAKAFAHVSSYDAMISTALGQGSLFSQFALGGELVQTLRYGENPHQTARWYKTRGASEGWQDAKIIQGKELSYNNLLDLDAALNLVRTFDQPVGVAVKHNNPCGAAIDADPREALRKCLTSDPLSVFGGIVALNREVDADQARQLIAVFLECVVAPSFTPEALEILATKKNLRVLERASLATMSHTPEVRTLDGGFLVQSIDRATAWDPAWTVRGDEPTAAIRNDLGFAWTVAASLKSNAIAICGGGQTLGLGMGQVNRVDAVDLAVARQQRFHAHAANAVLSSDAFFPFADSIEKIHAAGIRWVIQPGGSVRDSEVFAKAESLGVNLVLTGQRHFRH